MTMIRAAAFAALFLCAPAIALAQTVTLTARDGSLELSGRLLNFDGEFFQLEGNFGRVTVDGSKMICHGRACPDDGPFIAGVSFSGDAMVVRRLMPALIEAFGRARGYSTLKVVQSDRRFRYDLREASPARLVAQFSFAASTSGEGFEDLIADRADIVLALRPPQSERSQARSGIGRVLGLDAIVPVVAAENPLTAITRARLAQAFGRKLTSADLWEGEKPLRLHVPVQQSGLMRELRRRVLIPEGQVLGMPVTRHRETGQLTDAVARDPNALGVTTYSDIGAAVPLVVAGPCAFASVATADALRTVDYPLTLPLFLYPPARRLPKVAREFLAFTRSPEARLAVQQAGFVDQYLGTVPIEAQGERLAHAIEAAKEPGAQADLRRAVERIEGAARLTLTFRFEDGSTDLDAISQSNIGLLAGALNRGEFAGRTLLFSGFSDGTGPAADNRELSLDRARKVRDAVRAATTEEAMASLKLLADGFGEAMPLACDEVDWGRKINRRVEVWLR